MAGPTSLAQPWEMAMPADTVLVEAPLFLVLTFIMVVINMLFCFLGAKLLRFDLEDAIIASNAPGGHSFFLKEKRIKKRTLPAHWAVLRGRRSNLLKSAQWALFDYLFLFVIGVPANIYTVLVEAPLFLVLTFITFFL